MIFKTEKSYSSEDETTTMRSGTNDDEGCWLKDSELSWLEAWWSKPSSTSSIKTRLSQRRNKPHKKIAEIPSSPPATKVQPKLSHIGSISLKEFVREESVERDTYIVSDISAPTGLGLNLSILYTGTVIVRGLKPLTNGAESPAQVCGLIKPGDILIGINGVDLDRLDFIRITEILKSLEELGKRSLLTLRFRYNPKPEYAESRVAQLPEVRPNPELFLENSLLQVFGDGWDLNMFGTDHTPPSSSTGINQNQPQPTLTLPTSNASKGLDSFFSDFMQSVGWQKPISVSRKNISVVDLIQFDIRCRHIYPSVARVSCLSSLKNEQDVLHRLAQDAFDWRPRHLAYWYSAHFSEGLHLPARGRFSALICTPVGVDRDRVAIRLLAFQREHLARMSKKKGMKPSFTDQKWDYGEFRSFLQIVSSAMSGLESEAFKKSQPSQSQSSARKKGKIRLEDQESSLRRVQRALSSPMRLNELALATNPQTLSCSAATNTSGSVFFNDDVLEVEEGRFNGTDAVVRAEGFKERLALNVFTPVAATSWFMHFRNHHFISPTHDSVQILLRNGDSRSMLEQLELYLLGKIDLKPTVQNKIRQKDKEHKTFSLHCTHFPSGGAVRLPATSATYLVLYVLLSVPEIILHDERVGKILDLWESLTHAQDLLFVSKQPLAPAPAQPSTNYQPFNMDFTGKNSGNVYRKGALPSGSRWQFFFNLDASTTKDLTLYAAVLSDLLTLHFLLHCCKPLLSLLATPNNLSKLKLRSSRSTSDISESTDTSKTQENQRKTVTPPTSLYYTRTTKSQEFSPPPLSEIDLNMSRLTYLPVSLDSNTISSESDNKGKGNITQWDEEATKKFIDRYGSVLHLDMVMQVCSVLGFPAAFQSAWTAATSIGKSAQDPFYAGSVAFQQRVNELSYNLITAKQLLNHVSSAITRVLDPDAGALPARRALLSTILGHLPSLFNKNEHLANEFCVSLSPHIRPWNVKFALFGKTDPKLLSSLTLEASLRDKAESGTRSSLVTEQQVLWEQQTVRKYHSYLTRLVRAHPGVYRQEKKIINEWLEMSLRLAEVEEKEIHRLNQLSRKEERDSSRDKHVNSKSHHHHHHHHVSTVSNPSQTRFRAFMGCVKTILKSLNVKYAGNMNIKRNPVSQTNSPMGVRRDDSTWGNSEYGADEYAVDLLQAFCSCVQHGFVEGVIDVGRVLLIQHFSLEVVSLSSLLRGDFAIDHDGEEKGNKREFMLFRKVLLGVLKNVFTKYFKMVLGSISVGVEREQEDKNKKISESCVIEENLTSTSSREEKDMIDQLQQLIAFLWEVLPFFHLQQLQLEIIQGLNTDLIQMNKMDFLREKTIDDFKDILTPLIDSFLVNKEEKMKKVALEVSEIFLVAVGPAVTLKVLLVLPVKLVELLPVRFMATLL